MKHTVTKAPSDGATCFLQGQIASAWQGAIACYYHERQPGCSYNPSLWATKTIDQVWTKFQTIWLCCNGELYGKDYKEQQAIVLQTTHKIVQAIYERAKDGDNPELTTTLHSQPITEVLNWTKCHLDAYLATAEVYLEQNVDPG
jgi:hypothetical protein